MLPAARDWLEGLRESANDPRRRPRPAPDTTPESLAAERAIIAASLVTWLDGELPEVLAAHPPGREPAIVVTTSFAGLEAAAAVLGRDDPLTASLRPLVACVSELEYRLWCMRHPDPDHGLHVNHWNWIKTRVPAERWPALARYPLATGQAHWIHRRGTAAAGVDRRTSGLWRWDGRVAALVAAVIAERATTL